LRRQVGADVVGIDTRASDCGFAFIEPTTIDFGLIASAVESADYTLVEIEIEIEGEVLSADCTSCGEAVSWIELPSSAQRLELEERGEPGSAWLRATVNGWAGEHPLLQVLERRPASPTPNRAGARPGQAQE